MGASDVAHCEHQPLDLAHFRSPFVGRAMMSKSGACHRVDCCMIEMHRSCQLQHSKIHSFVVSEAIPAMDGVINRTVTTVDRACLFRTLGNYLSVYESPQQWAGLLCRCITCRACVHVVANTGNRNVDDHRPRSIHSLFLVQ